MWQFNLYGVVTYAMVLQHTPCDWPRRLYSVFGLWWAEMDLPDRECRLVCICPFLTLLPKYFARMVSGEGSCVGRVQSLATSWYQQSTKFLCLLQIVLQQTACWPDLTGHWIGKRLQASPPAILPAMFNNRILVIYLLTGQEALDLLLSVIAGVEYLEYMWRNYITP